MFLNRAEINSLWDFIGVDHPMGHPYPGSVFPHSWGGHTYFWPGKRVCAVAVRLLAKSFRSEDPSKDLEVLELGLPDIPTTDVKMTRWVGAILGADFVSRTLASQVAPISVAAQRAAARMRPDIVRDYFQRLLWLFFRVFQIDRALESVGRCPNSSGQAAELYL